MKAEPDLAGRQWKGDRNRREFSTDQSYHAEPIDCYVAPAEGTPHWYILTNHHGVIFNGSLPSATSQMPPEHIRKNGYRIASDEEVPNWRKASRDEVVALLWRNQFVAT